MSKLDAYLERKAAVLAERRSDYQAEPARAVVRLKSSSWVAGDTGARPMRIGETVWVTDAAAGLAGHGLGPTAPELLLGALASCLVHTYLIQAALLGVALDEVEISVHGALDMSGVVGLPAAQAPRMQDVVYSAQVTSPASADLIERLHKAVDVSCPVLNTVRYPVAVERV